MNKLEGIKEGDTVEVSVRGRVDGIGPGGGFGLVVDGGHWLATPFDKTDIASPHFFIKKVELPLAVGDSVRVVGGDVWEVSAPPRSDQSGTVEIVLWNREHGYWSVSMDDVELERI